MGIIHVIKVTPKANGELDVNPPRQDVDRKDDPTVIVWWLKNAGDVVFGEPGSKATGLRWEGQVPPAFSDSVQSVDGTRIIIDDSNGDPNGKAAVCVYELRAYDKVTMARYQTSLDLKGASTGPSPQTSNPAIINK